MFCPKYRNRTMTVLVVILACLAVFVLVKFHKEDSGCGTEVEEALAKQRKELTENEKGELITVCPKEYAQVLGDEKCGYTHVYSTSKKEWQKYTTGYKPLADDIVVSISSGEGKTFDFYFFSVRLKDALGTNLTVGNGSIFIKNGKMYIFYQSDLRMDEIIAHGNKFSTKRLSPNEIQKIYPDVEIIKTSDFKNGYLQITKNQPSQTYMLVSDTDYSGYNYSLGGCGLELKKDDVLPIFIIDSDKAKVVYASWGDCTSCTDERQCLTVEFIKSE